MPADRWDLLVKALAPSVKPRAMDSKRGWVALAQDWAGPKTMDSGDGWSAMCSQWGGGSAAMDEQSRDADGKFGSGSGSAKIEQTKTTKSALREKLSGMESSKLHSALKDNRLDTGVRKEVELELDDRANRGA